MTFLEKVLQNNNKLTKDKIIKGYCSYSFNLEKYSKCPVSSINNFPDCKACWNRIYNK